MTKLTEALRGQILAMKSQKTTKGIADEFGVSQSTIRRVFRESAAAEEAEAGNDEVEMSQPAAPEPRVRRLEAAAKDKTPTISLGQFNLREPKGQGAGLSVGFSDDIENVITDDNNELDDFTDEWNQGQEEEDEAEAEEEAEEDVVRPTKSDEKKFRAMKEEENELLRAALSPEAAALPILTKGAVNDLEADTELRSRYLSRIYLNVINFKDLLPFIKDKDKFLQGLHKKTTKELISLSGLIETQRSLGNVANQMKNVFFIVAKGTEFGCARVGMKVDGFADDLKQKERELEMIFQEIAVEQADSLKSYTTPQMRLAMIFTSSLMLCDSRNRVLGQRQRTDAHPVAPGLKEQFSDL